MASIEAHSGQPPDTSMVSEILQPQPRRLKRRLSALVTADPFDNSYNSCQQSTSKRVRLESTKTVLDWLCTLSYTSKPSRARSAPAMSRTHRSLPSASPPVAHPPSPSSFAPPPPPPPLAPVSAPPVANISSLYHPPPFFAPTPPPNASSYTESIASQSTTSKATKVENPLYRSTHLAGNGVFLLPPNQSLPSSLHPLAQQVRAARSSPQPDFEHYENDKELIGLEMGTDENAVERYMQKEVFTVPHATKRSDKKRMFQSVVPNDPATSLGISSPTPDSGYGYDRDEAFPEHRIQLINMGNEMVANGDDLMYPFLAIEFKSDGPFRSSGLWVATNQCLGGGSACVKITETLNLRLQQCHSPEIKRINSAAFSIAMNGTEARLFISWRGDDLAYYTRKMESYLLQRPEDFITFRRHVRNIIDWGRTERLTKIKEALDSLLEAGRVEASTKAKSRAPPTENIDSRVRRRRSSATTQTVSSGWIWSADHSQYYHIDAQGQYIWQSQMKNP